MESDLGLRMKFLGRPCWNRTKIEEWTRKVRVVGVVDGMNRTPDTPSYSQCCEVIHMGLQGYPQTVTVPSRSMARDVTSDKRAVGWACEGRADVRRAGSYRQPCGDRLPDRCQFLAQGRVRFELYCEFLLCVEYCRMILSAEKLANPRRG